jgi:putative ABC transport system permease protein
VRLSGRLRAAIVIGIQGIRARKLRTLLSMASLFLGVLAVVVVQAAAVSAENAALHDIELTQGIDGTRQMFVPGNEQTVPVILGAVAGRPEAVALGNLEATIGEPGVNPLNPGGSPFDEVNRFGPYPDVQPAFVCDQRGCFQKGPSNQALPKAQGAAIALHLTAMTGDVRQYKPFRLVSGRWLDFGDMPSLAPRLVINTAAAKGFEKYMVPAQLEVQGATADPTPQIIGVVDDGMSVPNAYTRADELLNWIPVANVGQAFGSMNLMLPPGGGDAEQILTARLVASGLSANDIHVETIDARRSIQRSLAITRAIFLGIASLVLLIGVGGILNVGLATVGERVEEFALRRAVGTPRLLLAGIVLSETLLTGLLTAAAAVGVAALMLKVVASVLAHREPSLAAIGFPWQAAVAGVIAGLAAGLLGGLIPAVRAARIPIATVMRA